MRISNDVSKSLLLQGAGWGVWGGILLYFAMKYAEPTDDFYWYGVIFGGGSVIACFVMTIIAIVKQRAMGSDNLYLKAVDFSANGVVFYFNRYYRNFKAKYQDIDSLDMELETTMVPGSGNPNPVLMKITLNFKLKNKKFSLETSTLTYMKKIYQVLDCGEKLNNFSRFSYKYTGTGSIRTLDEKINVYIATGQKKRFAKTQRNALRAFAVGSLVLGFAILFIIGIESNWNLEDLLELPIWALLFFVSSILFLIYKKA